MDLNFLDPGAPFLYRFFGFTTCRVAFVYIGLQIAPGSSGENG